ncbi:hypothetical protein BW722_06860 [Lawsonia intracellularis]|uniref:phage protease n=1 Tax=Lawsonia intracellularis TaxID=29546 RepID=UPI00097647C9|nr:phage protease [Lawsonia intracellularis]OMQ01694.1 hypothetical protein BW722_06860 [Lawsonia intracellularis]
MNRTLVSLMAEVPVDSIEDEQGLIHVFPLGSFTARDGRPGTLGVPATSWQLTLSGAQEVIRRWETRKTPLVIDYEHQTYETKGNGQPAPAAGWITRLLLHENGMFAGVEWTSRAKEYIRAGEYKYISPTFLFDATTGEVLELCSAALTNMPALDGMEPVKAKTHTTIQLPKKKYSHTGSNPLQEKGGALHLAMEFCEKGETDLFKENVSSLEASATAFLEEIKKTQGQQKRSKKNRSVSTKSNIQQEASSDRFSELMGLYHEAQKEVVSLKERIKEYECKEESLKLEQCIEKALSDGRLQHSCEAWARACAVSYPEVLRAFLEASTPMAALVSMQTRQGSHISQSGYGQSALLSTEEEHVRSQLGMSVETFIKHKKECQ